ncbi:MAG: hypothetical protein ACI4XO_02085, partial [Akkermansia sp.]
MKLHLPTRLRSALLACMALISPFAPSVSGVALTAGVAAFALCQAEASTLTSETTTVDGVTYSGYVIEYIRSTTGYFHNAQFASSAISDEENVLTITSDGSANARVLAYEDGDIVCGSQNLFLLFAKTNTAGYTHGHTLKLNSPVTDADISLQCSFGPITLGGLITTTTGSTTSYKINATSNSYKNFILVGGESGLNMDIGVDTILNGKGIEVLSGGTWKIAADQSLVLKSGTEALSFAKDQSIIVEGGGSLACLGTSAISNEGAIDFKNVDRIVLGSTINNTGTISIANGTEIIVASLPASITASQKAGRTSNQGNGFGYLKDLAESDINALKSAIITGSGTVTWGNSLKWSCFDDYYIYTPATGSDLELLSYATKSIYVGENVGVVKLVNNVASSVNVTVCGGSTWDINGLYNSLYTVTLNGGTLTNTGGDAGLAYMQITGLNLTANSFISGSSYHCLLAKGYGKTSLNLGGYTLTKEGACAFYAV